MHEIRDKDASQEIGIIGLKFLHNKTVSIEARSWSVLLQSPDID